MGFVCQVESGYSLLILPLTLCVGSDKHLYLLCAWCPCGSSEAGGDQYEKHGAPLLCMAASLARPWLSGGGHHWVCAWEERGLGFPRGPGSSTAAVLASLHPTQPQYQDQNMGLQLV